MSVAVCRSSSTPFHLEKDGINGPSMLTPMSPTPPQWLALAQELSNTNTTTTTTTVDETPAADAEKEEERPGSFDIWSSIQAQNAKQAADPPPPYVHPLVRRSSSLMSQKSLEICTESLGSETGSDDFSFFGDGIDSYNFEAEHEEERQDSNGDLTTRAARREDARPRLSSVAAEQVKVQVQRERKELTSVNYHCSISRRSVPRSFPPPLPSISRRDGPCLSMRPHRRDGRLVVEAVTVPSQNYLHAKRQDGRLLLSFIDATCGEPPGSGVETPEATEMPQQIPDLKVETKEGEKDEATAIEQEEEAELGGGELEEEEEEGSNCYGKEEEEVEEEMEEEEEVEVVDRGTVVEVKVSTQPQQPSRGMKVHRSSLVINKFVGGTPLTDDDRWAATHKEESWTHLLLHSSTTSNNNRHHTTAAAPPVTPRRAVATTSTAAAAAVAASALSASPEGYYDYCNHYCSSGRWPQPPPPPATDVDRLPPPDYKVLFTSKRRNREELLHQVRRCSQLRRPLFIWEPCCIATSS